MLAFVSAPDRGEGDLLLTRVARRLMIAGIAVGGVVQVNTEVDPDRPCQMDLRLLTDDSLFRISQSLGLNSTGCRLDSSGLEEVVGRVSAAVLASPPQILILNKFGKQEAEGRGFRSVIGQAVVSGVPVLTSVSAKNLKAFELFTGGAATALGQDEDAVIAWCMSGFSAARQL
ncbi:DUF2478 domain-containing protein [Pseudotabrizicola sp.]|uniref:DUF2478 domain-containing protein n=1 Tax=Pseudotabrizicola sp. TaxID=2939647 RepID=UPI002718D4D8|nr:DUF2478 domain-containing protein [Pseudotabrizicola sp.]MDO8882504.1 DUF2478 domain-containing protein [Pseudotabrizicola sp.]